MPHRAPPRPAAAIRFRSRTGRIFAKKTIYLRRQTLRVMKTHLLALLSLFCIGTASAQTPRDERIARAVERMDDGDYDEAARLLESVLAADPKNFLANYETGCLLYMQERYEEAVEVLRRIKRKDYPPLYQLLGNAYDMAGDRKRAVKTCVRTPTPDGSTSNWAISPTPNDSTTAPSPATAAAPRSIPPTRRTTAAWPCSTRSRPNRSGHSSGANCS